MKMPLNIVDFSAPDHLVDVIELLSTSLAEVANRDLFEWKHLGNPFGASQGLLAYQEDELVGARFYMQWRFTNGERKIEALRPVDTATHPQARGQGIFKRLNEEGLKRFAGGKLIFNTPNSNSLPGNLKMGWQKDPGFLSFYFRLRQISPKLVSNTKLIMTEDCPNTIPRDARPPGSYTTDRTPAFMKWRYGIGGYRFARFEDDPSNLLVYGVSAKGPLKVCRLIDYVGEPHKCSTLLETTASRERCLIVRSLTDSSVETSRSKLLSFKRGGAIVVTQRKAVPDMASSKLDLSMGDLQSIL